MTKLNSGIKDHRNFKKNGSDSVNHADSGNSTFSLTEFENLKNSGIQPNYDIDDDQINIKIFCIR